MAVYYGCNFKDAEDKELLRALVNNVCGKLNIKPGAVLIDALIEYNKLFDDKGNRI